MKVAIGADHAGFELKQTILESFPDIDFVDVGTSSLASCDYPDFAVAVAELVSSGEAATGILICGTGVGMAMAANKVPGIRAACCSETYTARLTRDHNDANVLCIGSRVVGDGVACDLVQVWLATAFGGGERHRRRLDKLTAIESQGSRP
ncbi:MAG: ribose 5-phosphate isomerase B [Armatimonadetes bacterium]|nr:ribose 5-phosphate isomerase B [Armatimonadota bacterium]